MRIGINLLSWVPGRRGGVETYNRNLLRALLELETDDQFVVFLGQEAAGALALGSPRLEESLCPVRSRRRWARARWEQTRFGAWVEQAGVQVLYCPHSLLPARCRVPLVQLIHDLQVFDLPQNFSALKRWYLYRRLPESARRATRVVAISEFTRQSVVQHLGVPAERVTVILEAAAPEFSPRPEAEIAELRRRYGVEGPYLLCLSTSHKHKQLDRLARVFGRLRAERGWTERLVLGGLPGSGERELQAALAEAACGEAVCHLGRLPAETLPALYSGAEGFIFPSCYEGFGLPVVEAMACGCPVASSSCGSLPEAAGDAALMFDATSEAELAAAVIRLVEEPALRADLRERGLARTAQLSWADTAARTLAVLHEAGQGRP
ncbi:MAG TPA: glycosyltransferase family 1 protein [Armatimonadota bacterium]|jgi:glycosyltransferase involved in cell wall biosynthesis